MKIPKWLLLGFVAIIALYLVTEMLWSLGLGFSSVHEWGTSQAGISVKSIVGAVTLFLGLVTGICEYIRHRKMRRPNESLPDQRP